MAERGSNPAPDGFCCDMESRAGRTQANDRDLLRQPNAGCSLRVKQPDGGVCASSRQPPALTVRLEQPD